MNEVDSNAPSMAQEEERPTGPTLGLLLRKAREARGMSVEDVVHALKFSARQVEAIESDRADLLPGAVFQRGFIRSYARLLKLDPEPLVGLIEVSAPVPAPEIRAPENMGNAAPRGGLGRIPPLVGISILLLIAAAIMIGWHYLGGALPSVFPQAGDSGKTTTESIVQPPAVIADTQAVSADDKAADDKGTVAADVAQSETPLASVAAEPPPASATLAPASEVRHLSFDFSGQSWIEVKDGSGLVILTGVHGSGIQSATGRPPFEVVIGNATVVTMRDEGKVVDLRPHTRAEVARLTLE